MALTNTIFISFSERKLPRYSVCHSFPYLFSNPLSALSLVSSGSQGTTTILGFLDKWHLKIFGKGMNWYNTRDRRWREVRISFSLLSTLGTIFTESCASPVDSQPFLLWSRVLGQPLTMVWLLLSSPAFWTLKTNSLLSSSRGSGFMLLLTSDYLTISYLILPLSHI